MQNPKLVNLPKSGCADALEDLLPAIADCVEDSIRAIGGTSGQDYDRKWLIEQAIKIALSGKTADFSIPLYYNTLTNKQTKG